MSAIRYRREQTEQGTGQCPREETEVRKRTLGEQVLINDECKGNNKILIYNERLMIIRKFIELRMFLMIDYSHIISF